MLEERQVRLQPSDFSEEEVYMAMGYRGATPEADICALVDEVWAEIRSLCIPRYMFQILEDNCPNCAYWLEEWSSLPEELLALICLE